jgi:hypothetical protein
LFLSRRRAFFEVIGMSQKQQIEYRELDLGGAL